MIYRYFEAVHLDNASICGLQPQGASRLRKMKPQVGGSGCVATVACESPARNRPYREAAFAPS
ncbi:MAG: hypothetical protein Q4B77_07275, partial [Coriobacteriaceae bacterium]|nr:hypothetical protein [Coriobacteriaceae bacterium]